VSQEGYYLQILWLKVSTYFSSPAHISYPAHSILRDFTTKMSYIWGNTHYEYFLRSRYRWKCTQP